MKIAIFAACSLFFLPGCQRPQGKWEVIEQVPVFKAADERDEIEYTLERGEICALGTERIVKVFMYRQVFCRKGAGWIRYDDGYPLRKID